MQYPQVESTELSLQNCLKWYDYHQAKYSNRFFATDAVFFLACRGFYLDSIGKKGQNDQNVYDDLIVAVNRSTNKYMAVRGNTDPSFHGQNKAKLRIGVYRFYRGNHKGDYLAFRPYPEGVRLACTRDGLPSDCANTNLHGGADIADGIGYDTWSEGCLTMPIRFFKRTFQPIWYKEIEQYHQTIDPNHINDRYLAEKKLGLGTKHFPVILLEKRAKENGSFIYSATGETI